MSAFGNMAQSMAQSVQPATATAPGLSKWFAAASAVQALSQVGQGFAGMQSANAEAGALEQQANLTMQQAQYDAQQKRRSVLQEAADQSEQYANSGVTLEGTPSRILEDTRRQGQQEVIRFRNAANTPLSFSVPKHCARNKQAVCRYLAGLPMPLWAR
jgi:hypothetical protein